MAESRVLSDEEAKGLGLPDARVASQKATASSRTLSDDEAKALGLPDATTAKPREPGLLDAGSTTGDFMHGAVQGGLMGFGDEIQGAGAAYQEANKRARRAVGLETPTDAEKEQEASESVLPESLMDVYRRERNAARKENKSAESSSPIAYNLGQLAAAVLTPTGKVGAGVKGAALIGGAAGLGNSDADLTKGEVVPAMVDTGTSAGAGAVIGKAGGAVANALANKAGAIKEGARAVQQKLAEKGFNSARGALGGEVSSASRTLELLEKAASDPSVPEEMSRRAADILASPEGAALKQQVIGSSIGRFAGQAPRIEDARDALWRAGQKLAPGAVDAATAARLSDPVTPVLGRLRELARRAIPPMVGGYAMNAALGPKWGVAGAGVGALIGAGMGKPGTVLANMVKDPAVALKLANGARAATQAGTGTAAEEAGLNQSKVRGAIQDYLDRQKAGAK